MYFFRFLTTLDPRIRPLIIVIKYWAKQCEVSCGNGKGFTTYALVMIVIFFLQQQSPPILPPLTTLQRLAVNKDFCQEWECSFCDEQSVIRSELDPEENKLSLKDLLEGFFTYYSTFDFKDVISPLIGKIVPTSNFTDPPSLPDEMKLYKEKAINSKDLFRVNVMIKVQDPFELCFNITRNVSDDICFIFRKACSISKQLCESCDEGILLNRLFSIEKDSLKEGNECFTFNIPYKSCQNTCPEGGELFNSEDEALVHWYDLTIQAILLILKEILKLEIETNTDCVNKVQKVNSNQDVHTQGNEERLYFCTGRAYVWNCRRQTEKLLNNPLDRYKYTTMFEKQVCISNTLYKPKEETRFCFNLSLTSFEKFKSKGKGIEMKIRDKFKKMAGIKEMINFLKFNFRVLLNQACDFILQTKKATITCEDKHSPENSLQSHLVENGKMSSVEPVGMSEGDFTRKWDNPVTSEKYRHNILRCQSKLFQSLGILSDDESINNNEMPGCEEVKDRQVFQYLDSVVDGKSSENNKMPMCEEIKDSLQEDAYPSTSSDNKPLAKMHTVHDPLSEDTTQNKLDSELFVQAENELKDCNTEYSHNPFLSSIINVYDKSSPKEEQKQNTNIILHNR